MKEKILMVVFILVLGSVWTTALVFIDSFTEPRIKEYARIKLRISILKALDIPYGEDDIEKVFEENIETIEKGEKKVYKSNKGDIAFKVSGSGAQGPIAGVVAIKSNLTIRGITIVHQEETPGLGDRVFEKETLDRFKGKKILPKILILTPGKAKGDNEVDGITGATLTCNAFEKILNTQIKDYISFIEEGNE